MLRRFIVVVPALALLGLACAAGGEADGASGGAGGSAASGGTSAAGGTAGSAASGGANPCGDGACSPDEDCLSCQADCGQCTTCPAPACAGAELPPATPPPKFEWNVKLEPLTPAGIDQRIDALLERKPLAAAILRSWLDGDALAGGPSWLGAIRAKVVARGADRSPRLAPLRARLAALPPLPERIPVVVLAGPGSTPECGSPLMRARLARLDVVEEVDDIRNDIVYCIINAEAPAGNEVRVTPLTNKLDNGQSYSYTVKEGMFWGTEKLKDPGGNLVITYDCIEQDASTEYAELITEIGNALQKIGEEQENTWLSNAGAAASIINLALSKNGDDHVFNAQQTLDAADYLGVAKGATWTVEKKGKHLASNWHWRLRIEMWGCAELAQ